ncbi:MAG: DUF4827 domain-containing protein [Bacteroidales bacterium]|jgi:hypothetical protein|nr:DUF4827 domain-containing protein [Bacteroidales bacterium]
MKQRFYIFALFAILSGTLYSCSDTETYAEQLAAEKASISAFMKSRGYTVTSTIPKDVPWSDGIFYKTESGLYIHVIDTGTYFIDTIPKNRPICVRYLEINMDEDTTYSNMYSSIPPMDINYNNVCSSTTYGDCLAWHEALDYVGNNGHVFIIAPANIGMSYYTNTSALTACFYELRFKFRE